VKKIFFRHSREKVNQMLLDSDAFVQLPKTELIIIIGIMSIKNEQAVLESFQQKSSFLLNQAAYR
jgi:hypothetical protein